MNSAINLEWMQKVFEPSTRECANGRTRILINDGFETHESLDVLTFCFENKIVLCRLPSHTSHKLQPCDVSVFGLLKTAYREQIEHLERRGSNTVNKEHFVLLYRKARDVALTTRNFRSGWSKAGLFPFNPSRVLDGMSAPIECPSVQPPPLGAPRVQTPLNHQTLTTPTTTEGVHYHYCMLEEVRREQQHRGSLPPKVSARDRESICRPFAFARSERKLAGAKRREESATKCEEHRDQPRRCEDHFIC